MCTIHFFFIFNLSLCALYGAISISHAGEINRYRHREKQTYTLPVDIMRLYHLFKRLFSTATTTTTTHHQQMLTTYNKRCTNSIVKHLSIEIKNITIIQQKKKANQLAFFQALLNEYTVMH